MNDMQKESIIDLFAVRAELCGMTLSPQAIGQLTDDVSDLDYYSVADTIRNWGKTNGGFPYPHKIREKLAPELNPEDDAQDVANLVIASISSCGYTNPGRAREQVGELGWEVVSRMGGWRHLCEVVTHDNEGMFRAQIRDYAETVRRKAVRGDLDTRPELPNSASVHSIISGSMKRLGGGE